MVKPMRQTCSLRESDRTPNKPRPIPDHNQETDMFKHRLAITGVTAATIVLFLSLAVTGFAQSKNPAPMGKGEKNPKTSSAMSEYLVISPHTAQECLAALDDVSKLGKDVLATYDWGCMSGDHTGYTKVQAASESEALKAVPQSIRGKARAVKIVKFSPEQIAMAHQGH